MTYGFKCPQCGGFKWGTLDCGKPKQEWIGTCNGDRDYPGCGFRWHRATEDEKIIGIPFGVHDTAPNTEFDAMDDTDRGTLLANLTISLFRTCERDLTEESLDRLLDEIERDDPAKALH